MLRTIAVWNRAPFVTAPLIMASLGLWGLFIYDVASFRGSWSDVSRVCQTSNGISGLTGAIIFMYGALCLYCYPIARHKMTCQILMLNIAMLFDLLVLALTTIRLLKYPGQSSLWRLLFRQGIVYFLIAFTAYLVPTIFLFLDLNSAHPFLISQ